MIRRRKALVVSQAVIVAWRATTTAMTWVAMAMARNNAASRTNSDAGAPSPALSTTPRMTSGPASVRAGADGDERAETDPTPGVGSQQRDQSAPAGRGCGPPSHQSPRRPRGAHEGVSSRRTTLPAMAMEPTVVVDTAAQTEPAEPAVELVEEELLVEEISIDGMCGVY